jgi:hypothetical protein
MNTPETAFLFKTINKKKNKITDLGRNTIVTEGEKDVRKQQSKHLQSN